MGVDEMFVVGWAEMGGLKYLGDAKWEGAFVDERLGRFLARLMAASDLHH